MSERSKIGRAVRKLRVIHTGMNEAIDYDTIAVSTGHLVACREGCSHCCNLVPTVTIVEALAIVLSLNESQLRDVERRVPSMVEMIDGGFIDTHSWFARELGCLFLKEGKCSVYDVRPIVCRTHLALGTSDNCAVDAVDVNVIRPDLHDFRGKCTRMAMDIGHTINAKMVVVPLPVGISWALKILQMGLDQFHRSLVGTPFEKDIDAVIFYVDRMKELDVKVEP